jgi:cell wall-associated NlpC family hydrolase
MRILNIATATVLLFGTTAVVTPSEAVAQTTVQVSDTRATRPSRALKVAKRYVGVPYVYGGSTPRGFDCSGYTRWVYKKIGVKLPRTASQQRRATKYVRYPKPGDLTFFHSHGRVYHVGIYAGHRYVYHAPRPGKRVKREKIWTHNVSYGRP